MTICVPKKPFSILGNLLLHVSRWSWVPILGILFFYANKEDKWDIMYLSLPLCFSQIFFTIIWFFDTNEKKHWIQWCETKKEAS